MYSAMESVSLKKMFNNTITIWRHSDTSDSFGGNTVAWVKKYWSIACRLYARRAPNYAIKIEGQSYEADMKMIVGKGVDIVRGDKVQEDGSDHIFIVVGVVGIKSKRRLNHIECYLARIDAV